MLVDATTLLGGEEIVADLVIVGGGTAGLTIASELVDAGLTVLVLESGGMHEEDAIQELYEGEMVGYDSWQLHTHRHRIYGGSSTRWAGWCMRMDAEDFDERAWIPHSGWPITLDDLVPFYEQAEDLLGLSHDWDGPALAEAMGFELWVPPGSIVDNKYFQFADSRRRLATTLGPAIEAAGNVTIYLHTNVRDIVVHEGLVDHLVCTTLEGTEFTVTAPEVVLATGGLENVRLLLTNGIANGSDAVGRYFQEHPHLDYSAVWLMNGEPDRSFYDRGTVHAELSSGAFEQEVRFLMQLDATTRAIEGLPSAVMFTRTLDPEEHDERVLPAEVVAAAAKLPGPNTFARMGVRIEQVPNPESRVTLSPTEVDALGVPTLVLDWQVTDRDWRDARRSVEMIASVMSAHELGRVWTSTGPVGLDWNPRPGGHHMGTTRMSSDPTRGVVDADCRCHDIHNLSIVSTGVFPTSSVVNPTLTLLALAYRYAAQVQ